MTVHCHRCGTSNLRPAHFRWTDLGFLFALCSPVRCRYCRLRFYVSIFRIRKIGREAEARRAREEYYAYVEKSPISERPTLGDRR